MIRRYVNKLRYEILVVKQDNFDKNIFHKFSTNYLLSYYVPLLMWNAGMYLRKLYI